MIFSESTLASERSIDFTVVFTSDTEYCKDASEDKKVEDALSAFLIKDNLVGCLVENQCEMKDYDCTWADKVLSIKFSLNQLVLLADPSVLTDDAAAINKATFSLTISTGVSVRAGGRVKRSDLSLSSGTVGSTTVTACGADYLSVNDACVQCPVGYGASNAKCVACPKGSYSDAKNIAACTTCSDGKTTLATGSDSADDCKDPSTLCTVPAAPENGALVPPPGASVADGFSIAVSCVSGYAVGDGMSDKFSCTGTPKAPSCYCKYTDILPY